MSEIEWLKPRVRRLVEMADSVRKIHPKIFYETGPWSIIKLLALLRFVNIYTRIIKAPRQSKFFRNMYYIDLLAGNGLCRVGSKGDVIAGSALVACKECYHPFDRYFFAERDPEYAEALEARIRTVTSNFKVFCCDCNDCLGDIMKEIGDNDHYLAFVDCEGLDVSWATMKSLFSKNGDVLFNFQSQGISRVQAKVKKGALGWKACRERLNWFYGDKRWMDCQTPDELLQAYMSKINEETTREIVLPLPVGGPRGYRYDIILATRMTRGRSPWMKPMEELRGMMGGYRPEIVDFTLDILMKRQLSLEDLLG